jgi:ribonuclease VapC
LKSVVVKPRRSSATAARKAPPVAAGPVVLDSSALLAFLRREPGADRVALRLRGALLSTVNYAEVLAKSAELGLPAGVVRGLLDDLEVRRVDFGQPHAEAAAALREPTRSLGLSLGDRACLALGMIEGATVLTADRAWADADVPTTVQLIR